MKVIKNISFGILVFVVLIAVFDMQPNTTYPPLAVLEQSAIARIL